MSSWTADWPASWAYDVIVIAWVVTFLYFLGSAVLTNRIKRREVFGARLLDRVLLSGGYFLMFSQAPIFGMAHLHFVPPQKALQIAGVVLTCVGLPLTIWSRVRLGRYWSGVVALKQDHRLIQSGPYRVVRHPALLASEFGAEFEAYRQRTGRLMPRLN